MQIILVDLIEPLSHRRLPVAFAAAVDRATTSFGTAAFRHRIRL